MSCSVFTPNMAKLLGQFVAGSRKQPINQALSFITTVVVQLVFYTGLELYIRMSA